MPCLLASELLLQMKNRFIGWRGFGPPLLASFVTFSLFHCSSLSSCTAQLLLPDPSQSRQKLQCWAAVQYVHSVLSGSFLANPCCRSCNPAYGPTVYDQPLPFVWGVPCCFSIMLPLSFSFCSFLGASYRAFGTTGFACSASIRISWTAEGAQKNSTHMEHIILLGSVSVKWRERIFLTEHTDLFHIMLKWLNCHARQPESIGLTVFSDAAYCESIIAENLS